MTLKVKIRTSLTRAKLKRDIEGSIFTPGAAKEMQDAMVKHIQAGKTPVRSAERFRQYSRDYAERRKGGKRRPVNMTLTGEMLRALRVRATRSSFRFIWKNKLVDIHDRQGAGRSKVIRRLIPRRGEQFAAGLLNLFTRIINRNKR